MTRFYWQANLAIIPYHEHLIVLISPFLLLFCLIFNFKNHIFNLVIINLISAVFGEIAIK
ncbi:MAG: hypothetical protein EOP33_02950 [Rickettsiaceae bacterium]|nr:MAG: hypothetical protein EOP33_02950 [Rickettsiaceae bacterium]